MWQAAPCCVKKNPGRGDSSSQRMTPRLRRDPSRDPASERRPTRCPRARRGYPTRPRRSDRHLWTLGRPNAAAAPNGLATATTLVNWLGPRLARETRSHRALCGMWQPMPGYVRKTLQAGASRSIKRRSSARDIPGGTSSVYWRRVRDVRIGPTRDMAVARASRATRQPGSSRLERRIQSQPLGRPSPPKVLKALSPVSFKRAYRSAGHSLAAG